MNNKKIFQDGQGQEEKQNETISAQEDQPKKTKIKRKRLVVVSVIIFFTILCMVLVSVAVFLNFSEKKLLETSDEKSEDQESTPVEVNLLTGSLECQEGWEEHRNDILGLTFCYPPSWGEPALEYPRYLTRISNMKEDFERLNIHYENSLNIIFKDSDHKISILLFNDEFTGKSSRGIVEPSDYYHNGATDQVAKLKGNGSICNYDIKFSYKYNDEMEPQSVNTLYSECKNNVKTALTEEVEFFGFDNIGYRYTYYLKLLAFKKIANGYFENVLISQNVDWLSQEKEKTNSLDEFFGVTKTKEEGHHPNQVEFADRQVEFEKFVASFSAISPVVSRPAEFSTAQGEDPNITVIRKYYWLISNGKLDEAHGMYVDSPVEFEEFKSWYSYTHHAEPYDFVALGDNSFEFHVDYQDHNDKSKDYRVKMTVSGKKITSSISEEIVSEPIISGEYSAYVKRKGDVNYVILVEGGKEVVVDQGYADFDKYNLGEVKFFNIEEFSSSGRYLIYGMTGWEWHLTYVYDLANKKRVLEFEGPEKYGFTKNESNIYYCMGPGMIGGNGAVYSIPGFEEEYNIYSSETSVAKGYMGIDCDYNKDGNYVAFYLDNQAEVGEPDMPKEIRFYLDGKKEQILDR